MTIPSGLLTTTCEIRRPFGSGTVVATGVACRLAAHLSVGRGGFSGVNYLTWTHYIDVDDSVDVRDGCNRTAGQDLINYNDGDEVRVPDAGGTSYVVVWVETRNRGSSLQFKRAYLLRHTAAWPGP